MSGVNPANTRLDEEVSKMSWRCLLCWSSRHLYQNEYICFGHTSARRLEVFKVLCYLQSEKTWVVVLQNLYMFGKKYHLHRIVGRINILSKYIIYIFFIFEGGFCRSSPMLFPKAPASCCKTSFKYFSLRCTSSFVSSKTLSQIFKLEI